MVENDSDMNKLFSYDFIFTPEKARIWVRANRGKDNNNNNKRPLTPKSMPPAGDEHAKLKT